MNLTGKAAVVTGGRRIGAVVAAGLARHGVDVALAYRGSAREAEQAADAVRAAGRRAAVTQVDLARPGDAQRLIARAAERFGRLDILVHMASVYRRIDFDALADADWVATLDVELSAAWRLAQAAVPHFRAEGGGRILYCSDWTAASGRPRYPGYLPYYVAKRAVIGLTEALALELAGDGILVNAIAPGPILPPPDLDRDQIEAVERATPVGRWGGAETVADAVVGVLRSDFITGETVRVDGGRHVL